MNQINRGFYGIAYITLIALIVLTVGIEYFQYHRHQDLILKDLKNRLDEHAINVNLRTQTIQGYVQGLKRTAENSLAYIKEFDHTSFLFQLLQESPNDEYFYLNFNDSRVNKAEIGNVSGLGSLGELVKNHRAEVNMALFLSTAFSIALKNCRGALWVYYISKNNFQNLYPWIPINPVVLSQAMQKNPSFLKAPSKANPRVLNFWTPAYGEQIASHSPYAHGLVVTNSSPIYEGDRFMGVVSMDLGLDELNRIVNQFSSPSGKLFLINRERQILGASGMEATPLPADRIVQLKEFLSPAILQKINRDLAHPIQWFSLEGNSLVYVKALQDAPWFIVYVDSKSKLFLDVFYDTLQDIFIISLLLMLIVGIGYTLILRNFISPAQKLVDHIQKENKGIPSHPRNIPQRWQSWFEIVSRIFAENRTLLEDLEHRVHIRTQELKQKNQELEQTLTALKKAKNQIIVQEKLASLGSLAAGIAHEIKNPLNFIVNFTDLSLDYLHELKEKIPNEEELFVLIEENMKKSREHAERADGIVKTMLNHARGSRGEISAFDLNTLLSQTIDLSYLGFQGQTSHFAANIKKDFDPNIEMIQGFEQDLVRVFLNIVNNACYSMNEKKVALGEGYQPELKVSTRDLGQEVEIVFQDNGKGMTPAVLKKIFTPFFTTKGAGIGTGLGLSLSYDIITRQHHGHIKAEGKSGQYSRFIIELPKKL